MKMLDGLLLFKELTTNAPKTLKNAKGKGRPNTFLVCSSNIKIFVQIILNKIFLGY